MREVIYGTGPFNEILKLLNLPELPYGTEHAKISFETDGNFELIVQGRAQKPEAGEDAVS